MLQYTQITRRSRRVATLAAALAPLVAAGALMADTAVRIDAAGKTGVAPVRYGMMTEEINHSYDGGLYAELIQNRAFRNDKDVPANWNTIGTGWATIALDKKVALNKNLPVSLRLDAVQASPDAPAGFSNDGYWGFPIKPNTTYKLSLHAKAGKDAPKQMKASLVGEKGEVYATATIDRSSDDWKEYTATLKTGADAPETTKAKFQITVDQPGTLYFSLVSLFPPTFNDQPNGFRPDIMQMMIDMKPTFLRFPGGNYLEGDTIEERFKWKETLGPLTERPGHQTPWGYRSTDGLGLLEFLKWCDACGAEPILGVYTGYSLKGEFVKPGKDLEPFIQEALEEIEYVTGDASTKWGARRAADGHPEPWKLKYVELGNEDWFDKSYSYNERYKQFYDAIKAKHPELTLISTVGTEVEDKKMFVTSMKPDMLDEHYYRPAAEMIKMSKDWYDKYDRSKLPPIFVGEWAAYEDEKPWEPPSKSLTPTPSMKTAVADAAFLTNMERNSDFVKLHCYAPMFVNVNPGARQWRPNLMGYDALHVFGSPSYYVLKMFGTTVGDEVVKSTVEGQGDVFAAVTRDSAKKQLNIRLVNANNEKETFKLQLDGATNLAKEAKLTQLSTGLIYDYNTIDNREKVKPKESTLTDVGQSFSITVPANSISVIEVKQN